MNTIDQEHWWLVEAGEYVLGTLRGAERDLFEKVMDSDADARAHVEFWEKHFSDIDAAWLEQRGPLQISENVWTQIRSRLNNTSESGLNVDSQSNKNASPLVDSEIMGKKPPNRLAWMGATALAMAASVLFTVATLSVLYPDATRTAPGSEQSGNEQASGEFNIVSVLPAESGEGLWTVLANSNSGQVQVIGLNPPAQSESLSHQLWIVLPDNAGVQSVGLLPYGVGAQSSYDFSDEAALANLVQGVAFAVSEEPPGGTTEAAPTGPVITSAEYTRVN